MTTATTEALRLTERINRIEPSATMAVVAEADKLRSQGIDVVDFGAGEPHFATPQHIKDAAIAAIQGNFTKYTAVAGTPELRDAIAHRHDVDFDSDYRREEVIASVGGKHALFNAIQVLVDHGDEVILPVPYWVSFKDIVRYAGGNCVLLHADEAQGFRVTADMVAGLITPRTKVIILNSPSNPSGAVMSPEDMTEVIRLAHQRGIWVLSDECYVYLNYTGKNFSVGSLREYKERFVVLGSLSKTYAMTGWRLGYALAPAAVTSAMAKLQSQSTSNPTSIVQKAAVAALKGPQECVEQMRQEYIQLARSCGRRLAVDSRNARAQSRKALFTRTRTSRLFSDAAGSNRHLMWPAGCCVRRTWRRCRERASGPASTFAFHTRRRRPNWIADWSGCGSFSPRCSLWKSFSPQRASTTGKRIWVRQRPFRLRAVFLFWPTLHGHSISMLMQPEFDPRPWGTQDLSPIYPNHKFEEKIGEAWLTG